MHENEKQFSFVKLSIKVPDIGWDEKQLCIFLGTKIKESTLLGQEKKLFIQKNYQFIYEKWKIVIKKIENPSWWWK